MSAGFNSGGPEASFIGGFVRNLDKGPDIRYYI